MKGGAAVDGIFSRSAVIGQEATRRLLRGVWGCVRNENKGVWASSFAVSMVIGLKVSLSSL